MEKRTKSSYRGSHWRIVTEEEGVISEVNKKGVYLDNGPGNDPNGPFDKKTGEHITIREVGMLGSQIIRPK